MLGIVSVILGMFEDLSRIKRFEVRFFNDIIVTLFEFKLRLLLLYWKVEPFICLFYISNLKKNISIKSEHRCLQDRNDESSNVTRNLKPKFSGYFNNLDFDRNMKQYERIVHEDFEIAKRKVLFVQFATTK